jgi:outer membrane protein assembly factor BamD (BamD/ComL family)
MKQRFFLLAAIFALLSSSLSAAYVFKNGKFIDVKDIATLPVEDHYNLGVEALQKKEWDEAVHQFRIVTINFPLSSWGAESFYFLGIAYYHADDKELANRNLSLYLSENQNPQYYEETFRYKLAIANDFKKGAKRHLFGQETLPQWVSGKDLAVSIYDEVISSLPNHEMAAKALISKASLLDKNEQYKESVETYQNIIKKFPKTEFAAKSYFLIAKSYVKQTQKEVHNPDILALAQINLRKFSQDFPRDAKIKDAEEAIATMKEIFANALYETGQFYERKSQPKASVLYYHSAVTQFPDTKTALECKARIKSLQQYADEIQLSETHSS